MFRQNIVSFIMTILLIAISGAVFVMTRDMTPGAELFPRIMAGGLALFGTVELVLNIFKTKRNESKPEQTKHIDAALAKKSLLYMGAFFALILIFFVSLPYAGFALIAIIFMFVSMLLIGGKKAFSKWPIALIVPAVLILVFKYGLDVRLPSLGIF